MSDICEINRPRTHCNRNPVICNNMINLEDSVLREISQTKTIAAGSHLHVESTKANS